MSKRRTLATDKNSFQTYCHSSDIIIFMKFDNQLISIHSIQLGLKQIVFHLNNNITQFNNLPKLAPKVEIFSNGGRFGCLFCNFASRCFQLRNTFVSNCLNSAAFSLPFQSGFFGMLQYERHVLEIIHDPLTHYSR